MNAGRVLRAGPVWAVWYFFYLSWLWCGAEAGLNTQLSKYLEQHSNVTAACPLGCEVCTESRAECLKCDYSHILYDSKCYTLEQTSYGLKCSRGCLKCRGRPVIYGMYRVRCFECRAGYTLDPNGTCDWADHNDDDYYSPYRFHFGGVFLLPCFLLVYLRAMRRRQQEQMEIINTQIIPQSPMDDQEVPESVQLQPIPLIIARPDSDGSDQSDQSDQDDEGAPLLDSSKEYSENPESNRATVVVVDPAGNIEVGMEEIPISKPKN